MNKIKILSTNHSFYYLLYLIAIITPFVVVSFEINVVIACALLFLLLFQNTYKISITLLNCLTLLLAIFIIAFAAHFFYNNELYDVIKDAVYLIKPFLFMLIGFMIASKLRNKEFIFKGVIYLGIILASVHLLNVILFLIEIQSFQVNYIRNVNGKDNFLELLTCSLLVLNRKNKYFRIKIRFKKFAIFVLVMSFVFYFSRTMFVAFFIFLLTVNGYTKLTKKSISVILTLLLGILIFYRILFSMDIERGADGFEGFLYKLKIAPSEIFDSNIDFNNPSDRWDHWRAYEAKKAIEQASNTDLNLGIIFGKGLGSLVDLGFEAQLGQEKLQYLPKIHNGYVYIFFKTGIIGLTLYLLFLIYLYLQAYNTTKSIKTYFTNNLISSIAIFYLFTSFIISGIYNPHDIFSLFLGSLLFLQLYYHKTT